MQKPFRNSTQRRILSIILTAVLAASATLSIANLNTQTSRAQPTDEDPCRFTTVERWSGTFSLQGTGGGHANELTWHINQSISGNFNVSAIVSPFCQFTQWNGDFSEQVSIHDEFINDNGGMSTYVGNGVLNGHYDPPHPDTLGSGGAQIVLDPTGDPTMDPGAKTYGIFIDPRFQVRLTTVTPPPNSMTSEANFIYTWGPKALPHQVHPRPNAGLPIVNIPIPVTGSILNGQFGYDDSDGPFPAHWNVSWNVHCDNDQKHLAVTPLLQNVLPWRSELMFNTTETIWAKGCALTALAMCLDFLGAAYTPGSLNQFLTPRGGYNGPNLLFDVATRLASGGTMRFNEFAAGTEGDIEDTLCLGLPVIVKVEVPPAINAEGGQHYVVVIGKQGTRYTILDPAFAQTTLDAYPTHTPRGYVSRVSSSNVATRLQRTRELSQSITATGQGLLAISGTNNVELLLIAPDGQHTGYDPSSGSLAQDIPKSVYFADALINAQTAEPPNGTSHQLVVNEPAGGSYQLVLTARQAGPYTITVDFYSDDGSQQQPIVLQGVTQPGSSIIPIQYVATPGGGSVVGTQSCAWISGLSVPFTPAGGSGSIDVSAPGGCNWTATSNANWITITSGANVTGNGRVVYAVANTGTSRSGTITVANQTLTVAQAGSLTPATVQFSLPNYNVAESGNYATVTVSRTGDVSGAATVDYATSDGNNALQRTDYTISTGSLSFAAGEASKSFTVLISDDAYFENDERLNVSLSNPTGASLGNPSTATVDIIDNDSNGSSDNPLDDADMRFFVRQHYLDFLNREPDPGGLAYWANEITKCGANSVCIHRARVDVSNAFFYELEFQQTGAYVYRLYREAFGNDQPFPNPDPGNVAEARKIPAYGVFMTDRARVVAGTNQAQQQLELATIFAQRPDFVSRYPASLNSAAFVDAILMRIQNDSGADLSSQRTALISLCDQSGRAAVLYRLADDNAQNPINNRVFIDDEYNRSFVYTQYAGYLRRDSDIGGFLFWLGKVNDFPVRNTVIQHAMVCAFITSLEYQQRFSQLAPRTNADCAQ